MSLKTSVVLAPFWQDKKKLKNHKTAVLMYVMLQNNMYKYRTVMSCNSCSFMNLINEWYTLTLNCSETYRADGLVISVFLSTKWRPSKMILLCHLRYSRCFMALNFIKLNWRPCVINFPDKLQCANRFPKSEKTKNQSRKQSSITLSNKCKDLTAIIWPINKRQYCILEMTSVGAQQDWEIQRNKTSFWEIKSSLVIISRCHSGLECPPWGLFSAGVSSHLSLSANVHIPPWSLHEFSSFPPPNDIRDQGSRRVISMTCNIQFE